MKEPSSSPSGSVVVIGASAGGIEALSTLIGTLEPSFPAPIVLAQHLEPNRISAIAGLFERRTRLPVVLIEGSTALEPGHLYVVPAGHHVLVEPGRVRLEPGEGHPQPSIDRLFASAANAYGERAYAVILSGSGSDGVAGAIEVKQQGGTVVVQNPATSRYPAMVLALPPTAIDQHAEVERIGPLLVDLLASAPADGAIDDESAFQRIVAMLSKRTGVDFTRYKRGTLMRRIGRRMAITYHAALADYADYLEREPGETEELLRAVLIRVTAFFRDAEAFALLRESVLPELIASARTRGRTLRFWSAGCSTGEEAYSLVLLVADLLGPELREWNVKVFGTDLEAGAIEYARRGNYPATVLEDLPEGFLARYFEPTDAGYRVNKTLRQMVVFGQQDLTRGVPFPRIDLATCRNLLIYLKPELQKAVLDLLCYSLRPSGGYLFLGKAETVQPSRGAFELVNKRWKIYRCRSDAAPPRVRPRGPLPETLARGRPSGSPRSTPSELDPMPSRRFSESLLKALPGGVVLLDASYRTVLMNATARRLLGVRDQGVDVDFLHAARGLPYKEIRALIDSVQRERGSASLDELELVDAVAPDAMLITVAASAVQLEPPDGAWLVLLNISDVTREVQYRRQLEAIQTEHEQLVGELGNANRRYAALNRELQQSNDALQASNEEMMLAHEELQAINEEFEATNEELQSTNEELETSNEELQATNEELEATNDELNARTADLQQAAQALTDEKHRLAEMVALAPASVLVVRGPEFRIEHLNSSFAKLLGSREVLGRPFEQVADTAALRQIAELARRCYREDAALGEHEVLRVDDDGVRRWYAYRAMPSHRHKGAIDGVVLYAEDVTEEVARRERERGDYLKLMIENAGQVAMGLFHGSDRTLVQANRRYRELLAQLGRGGEVLGRRWGELAFACGTLPVDVAVERAEQAGTFACADPLTIGEGVESTCWEWSLSAIPGETGGTAFYVLCAIEVTAQARAREALERIDRHKDEFLSLASHELRTPLVPLVAYSDMLEQLLREKSAPDWDARAQSHLAQFRRELQRMVRLIDDLLDVARVQSGKLTLARAPLDLREVVNHTVDAARVARGVEIRCSLPKEPVPVEADAQRLEQVLGNLVDNAIKFGGPAPVEVDVSHVDGWAEVAVKDRGPGIPAPHLAHVFDRFYQVNRADSNGLGLGLFITRSIVESHGGEISVESPPGGGTTFRVTLPKSTTTKTRPKRLVSP